MGASFSLESGNWDHKLLFTRFTKSSVVVFSEPEVPPDPIHISPVLPMETWFSFRERVLGATVKVLCGPREEVAGQCLRCCAATSPHLFYLGPTHETRNWVERTLACIGFLCLFVPAGEGVILSTQGGWHVFLWPRPRLLRLVIAA